jgi:hypothetical protein
MKLSNRRQAGLAVLGLGALVAGVVTVTSAAAASSPGAPAASHRTVTRPGVTGRTGAAALQPASPAAAARFWSGTDSNYIKIPHTTGTPYREPAIGGSYGGYIGMIGNWASMEHCGGIVVWSKSDSDAARINQRAYHLGVGVGAYWFMAGPGVDPHYNGKWAEATKWGQAQAAAALKAVAGHSPAITYPVIFLDVEIPGNAPQYTPAQDNGWKNVYTSACSGKVRISHMAAFLNRADFNGFANYLTAHSKFKAGVYSAPSIWADIFGTGKYASLANTYEWTYTGDSASLAHHPSGWCLSGTTTCAQFFGGITSASKYAVMWQWSGGGGTYNGYGDFDQIDGSRTP